MKQIEEEIVRLTAEIQTDPDARTYIARGKAYWNLGKYRLAINDYLTADSIEPNGEAAALLQVTKAILDYRNTDLLNP